jgi:hypothetical protein
MLLRALLLQAFYGIRSMRLLMERLDCDPLFRWFVCLGVDDPSGTPPPSQRIATGCWRARSPPPYWPRSWRIPGFAGSPRATNVSVDGTPIKAWASMKSVKPKDAVDGPADPPDDAPPPDGDSRGRNAEVDFRGRRRADETHASTTDPDARL